MKNDRGDIDVCATRTVQKGLSSTLSARGASIRIQSDCVHPCSEQFLIPELINSFPPPRPGGLCCFFGRIVRRPSGFEKPHRRFESCLVGEAIVTSVHRSHEPRGDAAIRRPCAQGVISQFRPVILTLCVKIPAHA